MNGWMAGSDVSLLNEAVNRDDCVVVLFALFRVYIKDREVEDFAPIRGELFE